MNATAVRHKRQTTLPAEVCEAAGIKVHDQIEWRFESGEIRGRKLESKGAVILGLEDVPKGRILPRGWKVDTAGIAAAIRQERDES